VFRYRLPGTVKMVGKRIGGHRAKGEQAQYGPACWVGYSLKNVSSHKMQLFGCKYKCNHLVAQIYFQKV
jgi:hypothetical protein